MNCGNHPDRERVAFCQDCGKPLCQECTRTIGSAVYCEGSLAARLAGGGIPNSAYPPGGANVNYNAPGAIPPPLSGEPNPGLAALLGFIPGVGAMYNGQYAKGVVHLIVFAILISLTDEHGIFGLFIAGWVIYQVIEAYHTALARRDGTPLPNPFGLNDLGDRLGFGKSWPGTHPPNYPSGAAPVPDPSAPPSGNTYVPPSATYPPPQSGPGWSAPWESYAQSIPPVPPVSPYGAPAYPSDPNLATRRNRFPTGAVWLIGLGAIFLIGNSRLFHGVSIHWLIPVLLIGFGVWIFVQKMTDTGAGLADDGTPAYRLRLFCALRGSMWIILIGVLFLLDSFRILTWRNSWPLLIIAAGLMAIFRRISYNSAAAAAYPYPPAAPVTASSASVVPSNPPDKEGN
jgi:TM2 domain-containing membrane protein YozV